MLVAATSRCVCSLLFAFELDLINVVAWFLELPKAPWRFQKIIKESVFHFDRLIFWSMFHIRRSKNQIADIFARFGVSGHNFIYFVQALMSLVFGMMYVSFLLFNKIHVLKNNYLSTLNILAYNIGPKKGCNQEQGKKILLFVILALHFLEEFLFYL